VTVVPGTTCASARNFYPTLRIQSRSVLIRPAEERDGHAIWEIFQAVVARRDTYVFAPDTSREDGVGYWFGRDVSSWVAEIDNVVVGMYKLIANRRDLGAHVSNASFMVHPRAAGQGVGRAMGIHCLQQARAQGYDAMQFNFVVSTNRRAVALWQRLGFRIVGTSPRAFRHGKHGLVDAYVMHRFLDDVVLTFGTSPPEGSAVVRPSAYAVIPNHRGEIAIVHAEEGVMLPGGGLDDDESCDAAVMREVEEECALRIKVTGNLGDAIQFVHSPKRAAHFEKRSQFAIAEILASTGGAPQHQTVWQAPHAAMQAVSYESHAWAIRRWARLNT
jgi:GNAT superfamily N-acetyltransferase/ADP-ribose pyrophosphatase YjhB (NUDIX family)